MAGKRLEGESPEYEKLRQELLEGEIALKEQVGKVAALRRSLPAGPLVTDYEFSEGAAGRGQVRQVRLSQLFPEGKDTLIAIHFMYGGAQEHPCPMCSMWADTYDAAARHLLQRAGLVLVAEAEIDKLQAWARERGWTKLRLLSSHGTTFKSDLKMQDDDGTQHPGVSVFTREADGSVRHFYTCEAGMAKDHWNGMDLLSPVWNLLDLTLEGRGDWFPSLSYD